MAVERGHNPPPPSAAGSHAPGQQGGCSTGGSRSAAQFGAAPGAGANCLPIAQHPPQRRDSPAVTSRGLQHEKAVKYLLWVPFLSLSRWDEHSHSAPLQGVFFPSTCRRRIDNSTADDCPHTGTWFPSNNLAFPKNPRRDTNTPSREVIILYTCIAGREGMLLLLLACDQQGTRPSYRENCSVPPQIRLENCFLAEDGTVTRIASGGRQRAD